MPFHQYSPLFTSGLLSDVSVSRTPSPSPSSTLLPPSNHPDTQPLSRKQKQKDGLRSFLFLADNQPSTPPQTDTDLTSPFWFGSRAASALPASDVHLAPLSPTSSSCHSSCQDLRHLPSPKPAPSSTLPHVPIPFGDAPSFRSSITLPSIFNRSSYPTQSQYSLPSFPDSPSVTRPPSIRSVSVKSEVKRHNRSAALACLEGRSKSSNRISRKSRNFMNMGDDDDDDDDNDDDNDGRDSVTFSDANSQQSASQPTLLRLSKNVARGSHSSSIPMNTSHSMSGTHHGHSRKRSRTIESWFPPLTNFIDLKEDDASSWRSFIEISRTG